MEIIRSIPLDDETALRLSALCHFLLVEDKKNIPPLALVRDSVARLHTSLMQARPKYAAFFAALQNSQTQVSADNSADDDDDDTANLPPLLTEFPLEFLKLSTGTNSVLLKRRFRCQFCDTAFFAPTLKTGSLVTKFDTRTQLETYAGVRPDSEKEFVDFALFNVMVCPACLYAATLSGFDVWGTNQRGEAEWIRRNKVKHSPKLKNAFRAHLPQRLIIARRAGKDGRNLFSTVRTEADAAIATELAMEALAFMRGRVNQSREAELFYQIAVLALMQSLMFEKQISDPECAGQVEKLRANRIASVRKALTALTDIPEQSAENFEVREVIRYYARRFWAAWELRDMKSVAVAGAALQRLNNQYVNMVNKLERDLAGEEAKLKKISEEIRKCAKPQQREAFEQQAKTTQGNISMIRNGMDNGRNVLKVIVPIYDEVSLDYEKFKEAQRAQRAANPQ